MFYERLFKYFRNQNKYFEVDYNILQYMFFIFLLGFSLNLVFGLLVFSTLINVLNAPQTVKKNVT